jgi:hypothetical protein
MTKMKRHSAVEGVIDVSERQMQPAESTTVLFVN